jgi:hypothetical protein
MYTCKRLVHGENHYKSLEECTALDVQQSTIYDSNQIPEWTGDYSTLVFHTCAQLQKHLSEDCYITWTSL